MNAPKMPQSGECKTKLKILYIDHAPVMGGAEHSLLALLTQLDRSRFEPVLASTRGTKLAEEAGRIGIKVKHPSLEQLRSVRNPATVFWRTSKGVAELVRLIRSERIDIVHANVMRSSIYGAMVSRLTKTPLVWHVRDIHRERSYLQIMSKLADRIVAISAAVKDSLPQWAHSKTSVVYNGLNLSEFDSSKEDGAGFRRDIGVADGEFLVGNVGWIAPWKGQRLFLEMASRIAGEKNNVRFVIVGDAADNRYADFCRQLRAYADEKLGERVIFAGSRRDMARVMAGLDLLVHCAKDEPFGRVLIEAMAMEKPVVAIHGGGADEIILDEVTGFLLPKGDVDALVRSVLTMEADSSLARSMGHEGRERVVSSFSLDTHVCHIERIYESIALRRK